MSIVRAGGTPIPVPYEALAGQLDLGRAGEPGSGARDSLRVRTSRVPCDARGARPIDLVR